MLARFLPKEFMRSTFTIALPIAMQSFLASMVNMIDVMMVGRLGDANIAAAGVANQVYFILNIVLLGICSGATVFMSQFWGKRDMNNLHRSIGLMYMLSFVFSTLFTVAATVFPEQVMSLYSKDAQVIALGADYLRIVGASYIVTALSCAMGYATRSVGQVKLPMFASMLSIVINMGLNFVLIFGMFGITPMGLRGAAVATSIARYVEFAVVAIAIYTLRLPVASKIRQMLDLNWDFVRRYAKTAAPVLINETFWSLGVSLYMVAYGQIGTGALAAVQINSTVSSIFLVLVRGITSACAIMIGHKIGAGDEVGARLDSKRFLFLVPVTGVLMCGLLLLSRPLIIQLFAVTPQTLDVTMLLFTLQAFLLIPKAFNMVIVVAICRSGGDTIFACLMDTLTVWLVAVPLAFLGVYLGFPIWGVFLCICAEDVVKAIVGVPRVLSGKWLHNVVADM